MKELIKTNLFYLLINFINASTTFLLIPLYVTHFSVGQYGVLALMNSFFAMLNIFMTLNIGNSVQTFFFDFSDDRKLLEEYIRNIYSFALMFASVCVLILLIFGPFLFGLIFESDLVSFYPYGILVAVNSLLTSVNQIHYVVLRNNENLKEYGVLVMISILLNVLLQVCLIKYFQFDIDGVLIGILIANLAIFAIVNTRTNYLTFNIKLDRIKGSIKFGLWLIPFLFIQWFLAKADRLVIENIIGLKQLGVYALLMNISMIISLVATSILTSIRPTLYREFKKTVKGVGQKVYFLFISFLVIIVLISAGIYFMVQYIDLFDIAKEYHQIKGFILLALTLFFVRVVTRFFNEYLTFLKRSSDLSFFSVLCFGLFVILIFNYKNSLSVSVLLEILIVTNLFSLLLTIIRCYYLSVKGLYERR